MKEETEKAAFVFGVSGHRDLVPGDVSALRKEVRHIFQRYIAIRRGCEFELLTPLAEGADRIAADEALPLGIKLIVPMPMAQSEYERDFTTTESLTDFRRLLKAAHSCFEVTEVSPVSDVDNRTRRYAGVGDYIARNSDVLILLWDGLDNRKVGGTAWVKMRREHWTRIAKESGTVPVPETIHVATRRATAMPQ